MTTSSPALAPAPTKHEIQSGEGSGVACDAKKKRGKWGVPPIWIRPWGRAVVGSFGLVRRVGAAGVTASSRRAWAASRRAAGGCGGGAASCGWATMGRWVEESQERFPFVLRRLVLIAGKGRPRERRVRDCRHGQTNEPKQMSHQKNVYVLFFLVVGDDGHGARDGGRARELSVVQLVRLLVVEHVHLGSSP